MAIRLRDFPAREAAAVRRALATIRRRLERPPAPMPQDLRQLLHAMIARPRPVVDLVSGGAHGACREGYARSAGYRILLCAKAFLPAPRSARAHRAMRLPAVLFHELIHIARGWELDAETFENAWFSAEEGARLPDGNDWAIFAEEHYEGWWVRVDPRTRRVTDYADRFILRFPPPSPPGPKGGWGGRGSGRRGPAAGRSPRGERTGREASPRPGGRASGRTA